MSNKIKVSVIIPVYNVEKYVSEAILSIINQSLNDIEIIIVNDGSTDSSLNIIKEFAAQDHRIQIISNPNQGLSIARNLGIYRAIGEYIYFFDSDDLLDKDTLRECYNKCLSETLDFLFFDADAFSEDNIPIERFNYDRAIKYEDKIYTGIEILNKQIKDNTYRSSACLNFIKRKYLNDIQLYFYPKIIHEDELFTFLLYLKANRVGLLKEKYFHRRVRENSIMTNSISKKNFYGYITVCRELKSYYIRYNTEKSEKNIIRNRINQLTFNMINMTNNLSSDEYNNINRIIYNEFYSFLNITIKIRLNIPKLYNILRRVKHL